MADIGNTRHRLVRCPGGALRKPPPGGSVSTRRRKPVPNVQRRRGNGCVSVVLRRIPSPETRGGCLADAVPVKAGTKKGPRRTAVCREWRRLLTTAGVAGLAWGASPRQGERSSRVSPEWTGTPKTTAAGAGLSAQSASGSPRRRAGVHSAPATPRFLSPHAEVRAKRASKQGRDGDFHDPARPNPSAATMEHVLAFDWRCSVTRETPSTVILRLDRRIVGSAHSRAEHPRQRVLQSSQVEPEDGSV